MGASVEWLKEQVDSVALDDDRMRVYIGDDRYIVGGMPAKGSSSPDYFSMSTIYDTIVDINHKIKYSFYCAYGCELSESLKDYQPFGPVQKNEKMAEYFIENMAFRTGTLWDLLAQLYNELWQIKKPIDKLYYTSFFHNLTQGKNARQEAKVIYSYLTEDEVIGDDTERWSGNHKFAKDFRDKMTHRNSPNITSLSSFSHELRPPAIFSLKRITEDYLQAMFFIEIATKEILDYFAQHPLF